MHLPGSCAKHHQVLPRVGRAPGSGVMNHHRLWALLSSVLLFVASVSLLVVLE
jgi:hypothetical protein